MSASAYILYKFYKDPLFRLFHDNSTKLMRACLSNQRTIDKGAVL